MFQCFNTLYINYITQPIYIAQKEGKKFKDQFIVILKIVSHCSIEMRCYNRHKIYVKIDLFKFYNSLIINP